MEKIKGKLQLAPKINSGRLYPVEIMNEELIKSGYTKGINTLEKKSALRKLRAERKSKVDYGDVVVYYGGHKPELKYKEESIRDKIRSSTTADEVESVLKKGKEYKKVSQGTINKWKKAAKEAAKKLADQVASL
jgi:hypothetical protein